MTYRLIESLDFERTITVGAITLPSIAVVEDDDGIRLLLVDTDTITGRQWAKASAMGVAAIVWHGITWAAQSTDTFLAGRIEIAARGVFVAPPQWIAFPHPPGLRDLVMVAVPAVAGRKGFVQLHAHSEFCLAPEVKVCTADLVWKPIGEVGVGEHLVGFGEDLRAPPGERGNSRSKMERTVVTHVKRVVQPCYRITMEGGVSIVASAQHGWVVNGTTRGSLVKPGGLPSGWGANTRRWLTTEKLVTGRKMPRLILWARPWESDPPVGMEREAAWLAGVLDGEGWLHDGQLSLGQNPGRVWDEIHRVCKALGYSVTADRVQSKKGPCCTFRFAGYETAMRVLSQCRPVRFAGRADEVWVGRRAGGPYSRPVQILSVEFLGDRETVAITTSTKTFVAGGFLSHNSPFDGLSRIHEMIAEAKADGQEAMGVTDHGVCAGHPELQALARKAEIKPVFGFEAYLVDDRFARPDPKPKPTDFPTINAEGFAEIVAAWKAEADRIRDYYHLILWAKTEAGLANLWAMSTEAHRDGFYSHPRLDWDTLARYHEGVMAASGCLRGPFARPILQEDPVRLLSNLGRLQGIFGDDLFAEICTPNLADQRIANEGIVSLAQERSLALIATTDAHYPCHHHKPVHKVWLASQTNKDLQDETGLFSGDTDYHMQTEAEVRKALDYLPEGIVDQAIANTVAVAAMCTAEVKGETHMPLYSKQGGIPRDRERAVEICLAAWDKTLGKSKDQDVYIARFEKEARLLSMKGFWGYYLIVWDYVRHARTNRVLVGPGRGSGGGSLIAYLMGIVGIDPVECDLIFERFLTEGRDSPPDFDIDFPTSKRPFMTDYVTDKYGSDSVVRVGTHTRLKNKGVIASLFRVLKDEMPLDFADQKKMSDLITRAEAHTAGLGLSWEALWEQHGDQLDQYRDKYPELFGYADIMVGRLKSYGRHAAGLVIASDRTLADRLPMRMAGDADNRQLVSDFPMDAMELLGLLKFDFLTLRTLDTIQVCIDMIEDRFGRYIDVDAWREEYDDPQVWEEIANGKTLGIFQIETVAGTRLTKQFGPRSISDLADVITLVRPGPKNSGLTDTYLRRRAGQEQVSYPDPRMAEALGRTQGCFAAQTRIVTKTGVREIGDLAGRRHDLMTIKGGFIEAEVRSFGVQPLRKIVLKRNRQEKEVYSTPEHRWFAKWHDKSSGFREVLTDDLKPGMVLQAQMPWRGGVGTTPSPYGIAAGITFGDGGRSQWQCHVDLHGDKNIQLLRYFSASRTTMPNDQDRYSEPYVRVLDLPRSWKDHPSLDEGASYLLGWMAGYFAADGCVDDKGEVTLATAHRVNAEFFRTVGHRVGIGTYGIRERIEEVPLPDGTRVKRTICYVGIVASTVPEGFFLVDQHRERFDAAKEVRVRKDRVQWTVVSVDETDRIEEVFCAVVPATHAFVLEDNILTGNCILYQEQIMAACANLAGYTLEEADGVRRILGKKKVDAVVAEGQRFLPACIANGMGEQAANLLWAQMAEFAKYSFNRSHAWGYAVLGYWTAWLKFHYPAQFLAAALSTVDKERIPEFITEAKRQGYEVLPPDVNASARGFTVQGTAIRYGLEGVAGIAEPTAAAIIAGQPYTSYEDFAVRKPVNVGVTAKLAAIGAFDSLVPNRRALEERLAWEASKDSVHCVLRDETVRIENDLPCTFDWASEPVTLGKSGRPLKGKPIPKKCSRACRQYVAPTPPNPTAEYTDEEIRSREMEMLGVWISSTPFDDLPDGVRNDVRTAEEVEDGLTDNDYVIAGYITGVRPTKDRHGADMGFVTFNAQNGLLDCVVFKDAWSQYHHLLRPKRMVFAVLRKDNRSLRLQSVAAVPNRPRQGVPA